MADQETITIGLETQNKVAEAIYLRWYRNGRRHPRQWNEMAMEDKEPWRRVAKDAIRTFFASPEFQTMLDDVYDEGYDDAKNEHEGEEPPASVNVPLHKWRSADPAILIGRRCIAQTDQDVIIDGRLELIRWPDGTASLRFQGIGNDIIDHDPNTCSNSMSDGIRSLAIYGKE